MSAVVGEPAERTDGIAKVTGEAIYGVDYGETGMLHARLVRSPVASGTLREIDASDAEQIPGVRRVLTAADAPTDRAGWVLREQLLFAADRVRYEGEPVALVVADTVEAAQAAARAIQLKIEPAPVVGDIEAALADDAPLIHPDWQSYEPVSGADHPRYGNVAAEVVADTDPEGFERAFAQAAKIVEDEFSAPRQYQAYLEPKSAVARFEGGKYTVHTAHQYPFNVRDRIAQYLGVRPSAVRVVGHHIGGGFGAKLDAALEPYAAFAAEKLRRPVKIVNDRTEDMLTCPCRENAIVRLRTALSADGDILARELVCLMDNGAYSGEMPWLAGLPVHVLGQVYRTGVPRVVGKLVYTNTAPTGAFRGVGGTYLYFAVERHMDNCARRLGLDRRAFRLRNLIRSGDAVVNGQVLEDADILAEAFDRIEEIAPWDERPTSSSNGKLRGAGVAAVTWMTNPGAGSVVLKLNEDGTTGVVTAGTENGSGAIAMGVTQIVAEAMGVRSEDVVVLMPDTDAAGYDGGSQGSRTTHVVGRAALIAAEELTQKIFDVAADLLESSPSDLELRDGEVAVKGVRQSGIPLATVGATATFTVGPLTGTGSYATPAPAFNPGCATGLLFPVFPTPSYHVHYVEVEVDPDTGQVDVVRYVVAQEVGKAINPAGVRGQIQGGVTQGLGYALYENVQIVDGRYQERRLETYRLPLAPDIPDVEIILLEHPEAAGPYGARGVAEPPVLPVAAAVGNAIADAIGAPITRIPFTPADVLTALHDAREGSVAAAQP